MVASSAATEGIDSVIQSQLRSLDDTDCFASAWSEAVAHAKESGATHASWGGRGKGGRGLARRTFQPQGVVVDNVRLEYISEAHSSLKSNLLLEDATLKLLPGHIYALIGRNGSGKSTLLRRIDAGSIPGYPIHISSMYIPQEVVVIDEESSMLDMVLANHEAYFKRSKEARQAQIEQLENQMDDLEDELEIEKICEQIAELDEEDGHDGLVVRKNAEDALKFFSIDEADWNKPSRELSGGQLKKALLAGALFCENNMLLLDEPTNFLDIVGLLHLRQLLDLCQQRNMIVLMVSHDIDLINDMATDTIHLFNKQLHYYPGTYRDFQGYRAQNDLHRLRQNAALEKKRDAAMKTIASIRNQPTPRRGGARKKGKQLNSKKKKLESLGIQKDEKGHRWTSQKAGTGIKEGSINSIDASSRSKMSHSQLLKRAETKVAPEPDKEVQFVFRDVQSTWGEPLVMAMDVGHGYDIEHLDGDATTHAAYEWKKPGFLFDCVDICIEESSINCILGANSSGKSTLLRLLAKLVQPLEGKVHHAQNVNVRYFDQHSADLLITKAAQDGTVTPLSLLQCRYPQKTEQECRGELTAFGLSPQQATTNVKFLSGGERVRLCLAYIMLSDPHVLLMDEPTSHLDAESVEALIYGLRNWNGTVVLVSHDSNLIRCLDGICHVIDPVKGKLQRVPEGIDSYLKAIKL